MKLKSVKKGETGKASQDQELTTLLTVLAFSQVWL